MTSRKISLDFDQLAVMPTIQAAVSPACNLSCPYCTQSDVRHNRIKKNLLTNQDFLKFAIKLPPTHFYITGGEPLLHNGLSVFFSIAAEAGHKVSFDTNGVVSLKRLERLLDRLPDENCGFFNITHHHLDTGISMAYIMERLHLLRARGIPHFVKYIALPEALDEIEANMDAVRESGSGVALTMLETNATKWHNESYPQDYTVAQLKRILGLMTLATHAVQLFGGIPCNKLLCRGGNDYITYNIKGANEITACCHRADKLKKQTTFFGGARRKKKPCKGTYCTGDLMFIFGIQGIWNEVERFAAVCNGKAEYQGARRMLAFVNQIHADYSVGNAVMLKRATLAIDESLWVPSGCKPSDRTAGIQATC